MPPHSCARRRDARALAALGLAAGITVPAALLGGPQAAALLYRVRTRLLSRRPAARLW